MTNLDSILKSREISLSTKIHLVKAMVFPVVMYGCERWTIKKAEHWRIDTFELRCWRRLLRVPWTARRSNQSILKEISPGCSLEGLMLKLKLQILATWCDMEQQTGSKSGKAYVKAMYCHPVYLTYMQSSVQSLSRVQLFETPWTAACQASLSITNSRSSPKLMSIESIDVIQPSHPLSSPFSPAPNPSQHQSLFQ